MLAVLVGVAVTAVLAVASSAQATTTYELKLLPTGHPGTLSLKSTTCDGALSTLQGETPGTRYTLAVAPHSFPGLSVTDVTIATNATSTCTRLVLTGSSNVFGKAVTVLIVGAWATAAATTPTFTVSIEFKSVGLGSLLTSAAGTNVGATLSHVWLAATTKSGGSSLTVTPGATTAALTDIRQFYTGFQGTTVSVAGSGLSFAGELASTGELATALSKLDVSNVQLTGKLVATLSKFSTTAPPSASAGFTVTAALSLNVSGLPSWLAFPSTAFTLKIAGTSSGNWSVGLNGKATVTLPPDTTTTQFTAGLTISKAGATTPVSVALSVQMGQLSTAFGLTWLTLTTAGLTWTVSKSTLSAALHAKVTLGTSPTTVALTATVNLSTGTGATATLSLTTTSATLSTAHLATYLGLTLPANTPTVTLKHLVVYLKVPKKGSGSVTVAVEAGASITFGSGATNVSFLFRDEVGKSVIVAAKTTTPFSLKTLDSSIPTTVNVSLTNLAIVFATSSVTLKSTALDTATKTFFAPLYCSPGTTCTFTVTVKAGVTIQAAVGLPTSLKQMVCKLVDPTTTPTPTTCITGPVTIDGHIPLFNTAKTVSLTIALPTVNISSGPVRRLTLSLSIAEATGTFILTAGGDLVLLAPSADVTGSGGCPNSVTRPTTDVCLTLTVNGTLKAGKTGVSVTLNAILTANTGWRLPSPVTWLTLDRLAVQIGITAGETGAGVTFGVAGKFTLGSTTFGFAVHLKATPEPPWIELLGFKLQSTNGIGKTQIAQLYHDVSGNTLTATLLPPLALKDLLLEYSATNDPTLGLCQGVYISADLIITNGTWSQGSSSAPSTMTCTPHPTSNTACSSNRGACLASVLIKVSKNGFIGKGHLSGFNAGPLYVTTTTLDITLTSTLVQFHVHAGGKLLTPFTWAQTKTSAPEWFGGTITLTVGSKRLYLYATGDIATLTGSISGTASFSTIANAGFTLTSWFTTVKQAFITAGNHIASAMQTVATTVSGWYSTYVAPTANQVVGDIQSAFTFFGSTGPPTWQKIETVFAKVTSAISGWNSAVNSVTFTFLDITSASIFHDVLHGITIGGVTLGLFTIPGIHIPGICSYVTTLKGTPLCTSSTLVTGAQVVYANPSVTTHLTSATLTLPTGASDKSLVTTLHAIDPTGNTSLSCAMATVDYNTATESPTTIQVNTLGNSFTISGPNPNDLGNPTNTTTNDTTLGQDTLNNLYNGTNAGPCTQAPTAPTTSAVPSFTLQLTQSWVYEGSTVTANGVAGTGITSVTITWGDGASSLATLTTATHTYSASHVYADETGGNGSTGPFTVTASATVSSSFTAPTPVTTSVAVYDAPLKLTALTVTPSTVDVMKTVTVTGKVLNPEAGEPVTGTITWGDGTHTSVAVSANGKFSASHVYDRLTPIGKPKESEPISVVLSETDGTGAHASSTVTVNDVPPTGLVSPTSGGIVTSDGTVFTHAGTSLGWTPEVTDVSPAQGFTFAFAWKDGTKNGQSTVAKPTPSTANTQGQYTYPVKLGAVSHKFADACLYTVTTTATDDDTLSTSLTTPVVVTAPLGFDPAAPGYWHQQFTTSPPPPGGRLPAATLGCYLKIAQRLSPELGSNLTPAAALAILQPAPAPRTAELAAQLRQILLTDLLDFANGSWNWTQEIALPPPAPGATGPYEETFRTLVANADQALTTGTFQAVQDAIQALHHAQASHSRLAWSSGTNGVFGFATTNYTTSEIETFTLTNPALGGREAPLPPALTIRLTGSSAFTIVASTCPTGSPASPAPTSCTVTVSFNPTASDTSYNATLTVGLGKPPLPGGQLEPIIGNLTLTATTR